jgi:hypothetical protein
VTAGWERAAAAAGIAFVALQLVAQGLIQVGGLEPAFDAPAEEIVAFFEARSPALFAVGAYLSLLALAAFLWFLGALWAALRRAEGDPAWLSLVAFGSGLAFVAALWDGWHLAMFRIEEALDPQIARLAFDIGNLGFAGSWVPLASLLLAAGAVSVRTGALTRWLGWVAVATGIGLLVARAVWTLPVAFVPWLAFWVWTVAVSIVLVRRAGAARRAPAE